MMQKLDVFNSPTNILNKKNNLYIIVWIILLLIFIVISTLIIIFYKFYEYETCLGYVKKLDDYKVVIYLKEFSKINDYKLYLDDQQLDFSVYSISSDYYIVNNDNYYEIILDLNLNDTYKIDNNILNLKLKKEQTTFLKKIKKGLGL
jgi:ABC-type sugar transport system permease subunit